MIHNWSQHDILVLVALSSIEDSSQSHQSLHCLHTQSNDLGDHRFR